MRNLKRFASMCLALALVVSIAGVTHFLTSANADSYDAAKVKLFTDIDNHWARTSLSNLIGYGYMHGVGDNKAAPNDSLTTAQLVTLLVRIMGGAEEADISSYVDVDKDDWYHTYFAQGISMGIVPNTNSNYLNPEQESSREYAAYMLCRAFGLTVREPIDGYNDADRVSDWAVSSMQAMVAAKAITGSNGSNSGRNLNPQETITRGEFAEMVYRLCENFIKDGDSANVRGGTMDGGVLISKSGVHMNGTTVKGNVYVSDAVGTGDVTLEDVTVEGNIYVRGSGERSIHLEGDTTANSVVFLNPYNATRLVVEDDAKINGVLINNGVDEVTLEGNVGNVTMNVSDVDLTLEKAVASNVVINSARSTITVEDDAKVETLSIASSSNGVTVDNKGELKRLALMANNAKLNLDGKLDYLLIGAVEGLELDLSKDITLGALDLHCSDSTITVDSDVKTINVSAFSEKLKLELGKNAKVLAVGISSASTDLAVDSAAEVGTVTLDAPKYKGKVTSDLKSLTIGAGATEAELTLAKDTDIDTLTINASKVKLIAESGSTVKNVNVTGSECSVTGQGAVAAVNLSETANKSSVETPNTKVSNAGASEVKVGTVDLPANKVYVTTSTGKDVIRNNDGTPDGDNDKTTGASQEVATVANFELSFAASAMANDIDPSGKWKLDDLVSGITLTKNTTGQGASYRLTGNVRKVDNFLPVFDPIAGYGTGYYVPVIVNAESMVRETGYEVVSSGTRYTSANLSKGTGYPGKLIAYLQLQSGTTNKIATISFDRDGAGNAYSPVTVSIDYSGMTFDGAQDLTGELFSYPVNATKADLTKDSKYALADFGKFNVVKSGGAAYTVSGTASYLEDAVNGNTGVVEGTHHYLPLMINTSSFNKGWTVVVNGTDRYTVSNVSTGTGCRGHLIVLLPLTESVGSNNNIYLDSDGDGRVDVGGSFTINCVSVALGPKGGGGQTPDNPDQPGGNPTFVEIPNTIQVVLDDTAASVVVNDLNGALYMNPVASNMQARAAEYIESYMNSQGYTEITRANFSTALVQFSGMKDGAKHSYLFSRDSGVKFFGMADTLPEGVTVVVPDEGGEIVVYDKNGVYTNLVTLVKNSSTLNAAKIAITEKIGEVTENKTDTGATLYAMKDGKTYTFHFDYTNGVKAGEPPIEPVAKVINVNYYVPNTGWERPIAIRVNEGTTVAQLAALLVKDNQDTVGNYYAMDGNGYDAKSLESDGATQVLHEGDTVTFGYYKLTNAMARSIDGGGVRLSIYNYDAPAPDSDFGGFEPMALGAPLIASQANEQTEFFIRAGTEIKVDFEFGALKDDAIQDTGIVTEGKTFKMTAAGVAFEFVESEGITLSEDKMTATVTGNRGVESLAITGDTVTLITSSEESISRGAFSIVYRIGSDVSYSLSVE